MFPQHRGPLLFLIGSNGHAKPAIVQLRGKVNFLWPFVQKQILMLRFYSILTNTSACRCSLHWEKSHMTVSRKIGGRAFSSTAVFRKK